MRIRLHDPGHASNLLSELNRCRQSRLYCDVILKVGSRSFAAHRAVLACAGSYFRNLLSQMPASPMATFSLQFISSSTFEKLLTFVYTGEILTDVTDVGVLHELAERLGVRGLVTACHTTFPDMQTSPPDNCKPSSPGNINLVFSETLAVSSSSSSSSSTAPSSSNASSNLSRFTSVGLKQEPLDVKSEKVEADVCFSTSPEGHVCNSQSDGSLQVKTELEDIGADAPIVSFSLSDSSPELQPFAHDSPSVDALSNQTDSLLMLQEVKDHHHSNPMEETTEDVIELSDSENFVEEEEDLMFVESRDNISNQEAGSAVSCQACSVLLPDDSSAISRHAESHLSDLGGCQVCGAAFPDRAAAVSHSLSHVGVRLHACDMCDLQFCTQGKLLRHMQQAQANGNTEQQGALLGSSNQELQCAACSQTLSRDFQAVKAHVLLHVRPDSLTCSVCLRSLPSFCSLLWHVVAHLRLTIFPCAHCGRCFAQRPLLDAHVSVHREEEENSPHCLRRPPLCISKGNAKLALEAQPSSSSSSSTSSSCDVIKLTSPRYRCRYCGKTFAHSGEFTYHLRIHTGEKPYQCRVCLRLFRGRSTIISHLRTHGGALMYRCTVCGHFCSTLKFITLHMQRHEHVLPPDFSIEQTFMYNDRSKEPLINNDLRTHHQQQTDFPSEVDTLQ